MYAFLSYQSADKLVAGRVKALLDSVGIQSFLAHEDITVSEEWRLAILAEIGRADIFVALLSANYYESFWCVQESGIAAFRADMLIIPLSIDGAIPQGLLGHIQSTRIDPDRPTRTDLFPALAKRDVAFVIDRLVEAVAASSSYRSAEGNFADLLPFIPRATDAQIVRLLVASERNSQVCNAGLCATKYLPPLLQSHGALLDPAVRKRLEQTLARYA